MSHKFRDITGQRGVTVNVFTDDDEWSIAFRLIQAIIDELKDKQETKQ